MAKRSRFPCQILGFERRRGLVERQRVTVALAADQLEAEAPKPVAGRLVSHPVDAAEFALAVEHVEVILGRCGGRAKDKMHLSAIIATALIAQHQTKGLHNTRWCEPIVCDACCVGVAPIKAMPPKAMLRMTPIAIREFAMIRGLFGMLSPPEFRLKSKANLAWARLSQLDFSQAGPIDD
jgi:hypothetical protein